MSSLVPTNTGASAASHSAEIRVLIAKHLDVGIQRVTDDAVLVDDLGADWLDRVELMIVIEDHFPGLQITEDDADKIQTVGDLVRYITSWKEKTTMTGALAGSAPGAPKGVGDEIPRN